MQCRPKCWEWPYWYFAEFWKLQSFKCLKCRQTLKLLQKYCKQQLKFKESAGVKKIECVNTDNCVIDCTISLLGTSNETIQTSLLEFLKLISIFGILSKMVFKWFLTQLKRRRAYVFRLFLLFWRFLTFCCFKRHFYFP